MPELAQTINAVSEANQRLEEANRAAAAARRELRDALRAAHQAGASYSFLGRVIGTSRQYVARIVDEAD